MQVLSWSHCGDSMLMETRRVLITTVHRAVDNASIATLSTRVKCNPYWASLTTEFKAHSLGQCTYKNRQLSLTAIYNLTFCIVMWVSNVSRLITISRLTYCCALIFNMGLSNLTIVTQPKSQYFFSWLQIKDSGTAFIPENCHQSHTNETFLSSTFQQGRLSQRQKTTYRVQHIGQISYFPFCKLMLTHPHLFLTHACCWLYSWQFKRQEHCWIRAVWSQQIYTATPLSMSLEKECFQGHITYSSGVYVEWWLGNGK